MTKIMKQFDHMIEQKLNLELSNVISRLKLLAVIFVINNRDTVIVVDTVQHK